MHVPSGRYVLPCLTLFLLCGCAVQQSPPVVFQCGGDALLQSRQRFQAGDPAMAEAVKDLRDRADRFMADGPFTIVHKQHPLPGVDVHDYVSLAPYFWPDPATKDGLPYIRHDGVHNPETAEYDAPLMSNLSSHVYTLAMMGYLTGERKYSDRAALLIRVWFFDPETRMNPNLQHAQLVKGLNTGRGTGVLETLRLINVLDGVGLLRGTPSWSDGDQKNLDAWFSEYRNWMLTSENGRAEGNAKNNHGSWYDVQIVIYSLFLGDQDTARQFAEGAKTKRIDKQILSTGEEPLELARTKSWGYSVFNLSALETLADLGERVNVDLWNYRTDDGRGIRTTLDFLIPYAAGEKKWEHQQIEGKPGGGLFIPLRRASVAFHDPKYEAAIVKIRAITPDPPDSFRYPAPKF